MHKSLLFLVLFFATFSTAKANFTFNARCTEAYKNVFKLRLNDARAIIKDEKQRNPQNGINVLLDNYADYFDVLMSENRTDYERLKDMESDRIDALEDNDKNSPYYLYSQAEVYLQLGILKAKFGDYISSFRDIKKARGLIKDNIAKYPDFILNQKDNAVIEAILGVLPSNLKGIAKFLGMSGNTQVGLTRLDKLHGELDNKNLDIYMDEVTFFLCYIQINLLHTKNHDKLMGYVRRMDDDSGLKNYLGGYVCAKTEHNDEAIQYLGIIQNGRQRLVLPAASYLLGYAKLCRMDTDANIYLARYLNEYKGGKYVKDTYLKLAYFYLLNNDLPKYNYYLTLVRSKGNINDEKDKQALREANDPAPNIDLLKARLYYDGAYYAKALALLNSKEQNDFKLPRDQLEYTYRLGRVFEKTGKHNEAIASYQKAINMGKATPYYYAANAALGTATIYELRKDYDNAATYYKLALSMKNHEYQNSAEYEAKQGLERIHR
jgi:tetratricopeptide (TPR) repeat protein